MNNNKNKKNKYNELIKFGLDNITSGNYSKSISAFESAIKIEKKTILPI